MNHTFCKNNQRSINHLVVFFCSQKDDPGHTSRRSRSRMAQVLSLSAQIPTGGHEAIGFACNGTVCLAAYGFLHYYIGFLSVFVFSPIFGDYEYKNGRFGHFAVIVHENQVISPKRLGRHTKMNNFSKSVAFLKKCGIMHVTLKVISPVRHKSVIMTDTDKFSTVKEGTRCYRLKNCPTRHPQHCKLTASTPHRRICACGWTWT